MQIKTVKYGLDDRIWMKKKQITLIIYSFTPSDMNFQTILMPKGILAYFCHKKYTHSDHSYLKYALADTIAVLIYKSG